MEKNINQEKAMELILNAELYIEHIKKTVEENRMNNGALKNMILLMIKLDCIFDNELKIEDFSKLF